MVVGLALCVVGIALARLNEVILGPGSPYLAVLYIVGVILGLVGLVVVASSLTRTTERVVQCPHCFTLNPADAERCKKCRRELKSPEDDGEEPS